MVREEDVVVVRGRQLENTPRMVLLDAREGGGGG